ncbi:unnamed protein product, partial [Scytosiphon promiscuus]
SLLGWVGEFVGFVVSLCPRFYIVRIDELAVAQTRGNDAEEKWPGVHWYVPAFTELESLRTSRQTFQTPTFTVETADAQPVALNLLVTFRIVDGSAYLTGNYEADDSLALAVACAGRNVAMRSTWDELTQPASKGRALEGKLRRAVAKEVHEYGIEIESVQPMDQVRVSRVIRLIGD